MLKTNNLRQDGGGVAARARMVLLGTWLALSLVQVADATEKPPPVRAAQPGKAAPDSRQLERDLQSLNWTQFKSVVYAIPPIRAEVDKYGPLGWQYVQQNYRTYPWKKSIDRLSGGQKLELARLIERAKKPG